MSTSPHAQQAQVVSRANPADSLFGAALLLFFAAMALNIVIRSPTETSGGRLFLAAMTVICGAGALFFLWQAVSRKIVASPQGLRWRSWVTWSSAGWDEISDYFAGPQTKSVTKLFIQTSRGTIEFDDSWLRSEQLKAAVADRAFAAPPREWELRLVRETDPWPRTFDYLSRSARRARILKMLPAPGVMALMLATAAPAMWDAYSGSRSVEEWIYGLPLLGFGFLWVGLMWWPSLIIHRDARSRSLQRITAMPDSVLFEEPGARLEARWDEITSTELLPLGRRLQLDGRRHVVTTRQGAFDFTAQISEFDALKRLIDEKATDRAIPGWSRAEGEIPPESSRSLELIGSHTFHYRTRDMRILLRAAGALVLLMSVIALKRAWESIDGGWPPISDHILMLTLFVGAFLLFWSWYRRAAIRISEHGVTKVWLLGSKTMAWSEIREYYEHARDTTLVLKGRDRSIRFLSSVQGRDALKREIARRATKAETRRWEKR